MNKLNVIAMITSLSVSSIPLLAVHEVSSVRELVQDAEHYDGQLVEVRGFYMQKAPDLALFPDREAFREDDFRYALWIGGYHSEFQGDDRGRCDECDVVVAGVFVKGELGIFGILKGQIIDIQKFEILSKSSSQSRSSIGLRLRKRFLVGR